MSERVKLLPHQGGIGTEIRPLFFYQSFGLEIPNCRVISFGACNFNCQYCKRNGFFRLKDGSIVNSVEIGIDQLLAICEDAISHSQVVRISGGDPVLFPETSLAIARFVNDHYGRLSLAHNGSSPAFVAKISRYLESAAIDLKAPPTYISSIIGLTPDVAKHMYRRSLESQQILLDAGVMVDVRTPIFNFTTLDDLLILASDLNTMSDRGKIFWTLRAYSEVNWCDFKKPDYENLLWIGKEIKQLFPTLKIGIRAKWETCGFIYL